MKRLNQNNAIAPTAMMTKMNVMKNKMNLFAKVVIILVMILAGEGEWNSAWGANVDKTTWVYYNGKWYIFNTDQFNSDNWVSLGSSRQNPWDDYHKGDLYAITPVVNTDASGTVQFKSGGGGGSIYIRFFVNGTSIYTGNNQRKEVDGGDTRDPDNFTLSKSSSNATCQAAFHSITAIGNKQEKFFKAQIPVPSHCALTYSGAGNNDINSYTFADTEVDSEPTETLTFYSFCFTAGCTIVNSNTSDFEVTTNMPGTANFCGQPSKGTNFSGNASDLQNPGSYNITVKFKPTTAGDKSTTITIKDGTTDIKTITISGNATRHTSSITTNSSKQYFTTDGQKSFTIGTNNCDFICNANEVLQDVIVSSSNTNYFTVDNGNKTLTIVGADQNNDNSVTAYLVANFEETDRYTATNCSIPVTITKVDAGLQLQDIGSPYVFTTVNLSANKTTPATVSYTSLSTNNTVSGSVLTLNKVEPTTITATTAGTTIYKSGIDSKTFTPQKVTPVLSWSGGELGGSNKGGDKVYLSGYSWSLQEVANPSVSPLPGISAKFESDNTNVATTGQDANGWYVQMNGAGTCNITMSVITDDNYNPANPSTITHSVTVSGKSDQTIIWNDDFSNMKVGDNKTLTATSVKTNAQTEETGLTVNYTPSPAGIVSISNVTTMTCQKAGYVTVTASQSGDDAYEPAESKSKSFKVDFATDVFLPCSAAVIDTPSTTTLDMSQWFVPSGNGEYTASAPAGSEFSVTGVLGNTITIQFAPTSVNINSDTEEKEATITIDDNGQTYSFKVKATAEKKNASLVLDAIGNPDPYVFSTITPSLSTQTTDAASVTYTYNYNGGTTTGVSFKLPSIDPVNVTATTPATTVYKAGTSNTITVNPQPVTPTITFGTITGTAHVGTNFTLNGADWTSATKSPAQPARSEWTNEQVDIVYSTTIGTVADDGKTLSSTKAGYATITADIYEAGNHTDADNELTSGLKIDFANNFALQFTGNVLVNDTLSQTFDMADYFVPDGDYTVAVTPSGSEFSVSSDPISDNKITVTFAPTSVNSGSDTEEKTCTLQITNNDQTYTFMVRATAEKRDAVLVIDPITNPYVFSTITPSYSTKTTDATSVTYTYTDADGDILGTGASFKLPSIDPVNVTATTPATTVYKAGTSNTITIDPLRVTPKVTVTNWSGRYPDQKVGTPCAIGQADWDVDVNVDAYQPAKGEWADGEVTIVYTSSDENIAEVSGSDLVFHEAGLATITASIPEEKNHNASTNSPERLVMVDFSDDAVDCGAAYVGESPATRDITDMIVLPETGTTTAASDNPEFSVVLSDEKIEIAYIPTYFPSNDGVNSGVITFTYKDNDNNEYEFHLNVSGTCLRKTPTIVWMDNKALKKNDTQENRQIVELLKSYSYLDGGVTISSSDTSVIKVYKADGTASDDYEAGITFWAYGVGTATLTITIPATDIHEELTVSAEFAVTDKEICEIVLDQEELLKNLYVGDEFELIAHVVNENGEEITNATVSYVIEGTDGIVSLSNTDGIWTLAAVAETDEGTPVQLTATATIPDGTDGEEYFAPTVKYDVIVNALSGGCDAYIYESTGNITSTATIATFKTRGDGTPYPVGELTYDYTLAECISIPIIGVCINSRKITISQKIGDDSEEKASETQESTAKSGSGGPISLSSNATGLTFTDVNNNNYFSNVKVTQASYFEYGITTAYDFGSCQTSVPKQMLIRNVAKYSNLNGPVRAIITSGNKYFKVVDSDQNHLGTGCGDFGDVAVMVEYMADDDDVLHEGKLKLVGYIGTTREEVKIDLTGISKNTVQKISWPVGFEDGATIIASEGTIDLSEIGSVTTKGDTGGDVSFTISPDASISDDNILTFTTDGYYELTATAAEITIDGDDYDAVSETHTFYLTQGGSCGEYCFNDIIENTGPYTFFPSTSVPDKLIGTLTYTGIGLRGADYTIQDNNRNAISTGSGIRQNGNIEEHVFLGNETGIRVTTLTRCSLNVQVKQKTDKQLKYSGEVITSGSTIDFEGQLIGEESKPKEVEIEYWNMPFMNAELIGNDDNHFRLEQVVDGMAKCNCHGTTKYRIYFTPSSIDDVVTCTLKLTYSTDVNNPPPLILILTGYGKRLDPGLYQIKSLPAGLKYLDSIPLNGYAGVNPKNTEQTVKYVALSSQTGTELSEVAEVVDNTDGTQSLKILKPGDFYLKAYVEQSNTYTSASFVYPVYHAGKAIRTVAWGDNTSSLTIASPDVTLDAYTVNKNNERIADNVAGTVIYSIESASEIGGKSFNCVELSSDNTTLIINGEGTATLKAYFSGSCMYEDASATWDITIDNETLTIAVTDPAEILITSTDENVNMWDYFNASNFDGETIEKSVSQPVGMDGVLSITDGQKMTVMKEATTATVQVPCTVTVTSRYLANGSYPTATGNIEFSISKGTLIFNVAEGSDDNKWTTPANWSRPDIVNLHTDGNLSEYNVQINASCFIGKDEEEVSDETTFLEHTVNAACHDLSFTNDENAKLVIGEASTLNVVGNLTNGDADKLLLTANYWGQASVVFNNGSPKATIEMYIPEGNGSHIDPKWQYRGICVDEFEAVDGPWECMAIYWWKEANNSNHENGCWDLVTNGGGAKENINLTPWTGYCFANICSDDDRKAENWLTYSGTLINASHEFGLTKTDDKKRDDGTTYENCGVNLLTNSYAAPMTIGDIDFDDNNDDAAYATVTFYNAGSHKDWKDHHSDATDENQHGDPGQMTVCPKITGGTVQNTFTIPAGQSFFVTAKNNNNTVTFDYSIIK